jgi:uroporphyrinogen-III synthase
MRVLITRPRTQAASFAAALHDLGIETVYFPTIDIKPVQDNTCLDTALFQLDKYDWVVLTSVNAADALIKRMMDLGVKSPPTDLRFAVVGPRTAARLITAGVTPDFIPERYIAKAIVPGLGDLSDRWVLLPMADIAPDTLPMAIQEAGGIAHVVTAYHTIPADLDPVGLAAIKQGVDYITFTSGSTANNFYSLVHSAGLNPLQLPGDPKIVCIGPKTGKAASELGFEVNIVADPHTSDGLISALKSQILLEA